MSNELIPSKELALSERNAASELSQLETFSGFPEPLIKANAQVLRRWHNERVERLFREDIQDVEIIRDLGSMNLLLELLPRKVGSLLSINSCPG